MHAFFSDHGPQTGDGAPTIGHAAARSEISGAGTALVHALHAQGG